MSIKEDLSNGAGDIQDPVNGEGSVETSMHDGIAFTTASAEDVDKVVELLKPILDQNHPAVCVMAFLAMCIMLQRPYSTRSEVMEGVRTVSEWIAMYLNGLEVVELDKNKLN